MSTPRKQSPKITNISKEELLELRLAISEVDRIDAQIKLLQSQLQLLAPALRPAQLKLTQLKKNLEEEYGLEEKDSLDLQTGAITRGKKDDKEE